MSLLALLFVGIAAQDDLDQRIAALRPTAEEEKWLSVGWRTHPQRARLEAQEKGKPIFVWMMNGHPMGCT